MITPYYQNLIKLPFFAGWQILSFEMVFQCEGMEEPVMHPAQTFFDENGTDEQIEMFIQQYMTIYIAEYCAGEWQQQLQARNVK